MSRFLDILFRPIPLSLFLGLVIGIIGFVDYGSKGILAGVGLSAFLILSALAMMWAERKGGHR